MTDMPPIGEFLADLERSTILRHKVEAEPKNPLATETPQEMQRRIIAEHDRRSGRTTRGLPTKDLIRRALGESDKLLRARREAVLATMQRDPTTTPTKIAEALQTAMTTIQRDLEALRLGGLIPAKGDQADA